MTEFLICLNDDMVKYVKDMVNSDLKFTEIYNSDPYLDDSYPILKGILSAIETARKVIE